MAAHPPTVYPAWFDLDAGPDVTPSLPTGPVAADVVVVGLGASGLAACWQLAEGGANVVGLDAVGVAGGAAGANGGFLLAGLAMFHHDAVARLGRARAARAYAWTLLRLHEEYEVEPTARRTGSLRLAADDVAGGAEPRSGEHARGSADELADIRAHLAALRADGFDAEPFDGPEGRGLLVPTDGVVHPVARCRRLASAAMKAGARLYAPLRVTRVAPGVVEADGVAVSADSIVVAVDGGLEDLVPGLGVRSARLQMLATAPAPVARSRPEYRRWGYDYVQQLPTGHVVMGGGRDVGGDVEWGAPAEPSESVQAHLDHELARLGVTAEVTHRWAARAGFTDDLLPVSRTIADGVHVVGAYSGHGNVIGPALARRAAAVVLDGGRLELPW